MENKFAKINIVYWYLGFTLLVFTGFYNLIFEIAAYLMTWLSFIGQSHALKSTLG